MESTLQLEEKRSSYIRTAEAIISKALREGRALRPGENAEVESLEQKIDNCDLTLKRYSRFSGGEGNPGLSFARCVRALAGTRGNLEGAQQFAIANGDRDLYRALSASVATAGGYAVPGDYSSDIIAALRPLVSVRKLNPVVIPMPHGNFHLARISTGATVGYIGENQLVPQTQPMFQQLSLDGRKMAALCPISNSLLRSSKPAADVIVRDDLIAAVASTEDLAFLYGSGGQYSPRGLRNWVKAANLFTASATIDIPHIDADLSTLESALVAANVKMLRPGWIMSTRTATFLQSIRSPNSGVRAYPEMDNGLLRGKPFAATTNVPTNLGTGSGSEIFLCDFADVAIGEFPLIIDASSTGVYTDSAGGKVSAFSSDQTIIRVIMQHDIGLRHDESLAILTGVAY